MLLNFESNLFLVATLISRLSFKINDFVVFIFCCKVDPYT